MGSTPPKSISRKFGSKTGASGSVANNDEIFNLLSSELSFSKSLVSDKNTN